MDRFVVRAPTWKTLEMSSFSRSFANVSLTGKKSTPKEDKTKQSNKRLSIRDESLMKIFASQPDEPLVVDRLDNSSPVLLRYNGSFGASGAVSNEKNSQQSLRLASNDENTPPPNAQITSNNETVTNVMCSSEDSNSRPSTPVNSMIPSNLACTPKDHPFLARIQKDLNSPSAAMRVRALKALRSPTKSTYGNFDIPYEEQDIITDEERKSPVKVKSIQELMKDVVVYVEVRTGEDNRSSGIKKVISALGAKVNDKLLRDTTHVVFKDGLLSTYNKAKKWNIPIVSILWIEACKKQMRLMSPTDYPISNADRYENPELYDKMKRYKSMQPDAEENRRQRAKLPCKENGLKPKAAPATPTSTKKKTDITSFFASIDKLKSTPSQSSSTDAVKTVERVNDNTCDSKKSNDTLLKLAELDSLSTLSDTVDSISSKPNNAKSTTDFERIQSNSKTCATPRTPSRRRNSIQIAQTPNRSDNTLVNTENNVPATPNTRNRRRTSTHIPTNVSVPEKDGEKLQRKLYSTIDEEIVEDSNQIVEKRQTNCTEATMNITKGTPLNKPQNSRRRTLYTPKAMEETALRSLKDTPDNRRRTVFFQSSSKLSDGSSMELSTVSSLTPIDSRIPSSTLIGDSQSLKTPIQFGSLLEEHSSATIFRSGKPATNPRRRTLFDVSMDIISQRLQNINQSAKSVKTGRPEDPATDRRSSYDDSEALLTPTGDKNSAVRKELFAGTENSATVPTTPQVTTAAAAATTSSAGETTKKKRKLFVPNEILLTPTSQPVISELDDATSKKSRNPNDIATPTTNTKRRKTIMPTLTQPKSEQKKPAPRSNGSAASHSSRRSTMDFEAIKKTKTAIKKSTVAATTPSTTPGETNNNNNNKPKPYPFLVYTNMHTEQIEFIKEAISKIQGFQLEDNVSDKTTHIVSLEPRRTINLLRGMVRGLWIVNYNWVLDSVKAGRWLDEEQYEMREFSRAVEICRSERQAFGNGYRMDLFSDLGGMYISSKSNIPSNNLKELVLLCAGRLVDRRKRARYIVGDSSQEAVLPDKIYVQPQWILDSITHKQIQNPTKYCSNLVADKHIGSQI